MTDDELIAEFIRAERRNQVLQISLAHIEWPSPEEPKTTWRVVTRLQADASEEEIRQAIGTVLSDKRYFMTCGECGKKQPKGCMDDGEICQSCASKNHGVVY